MEKMCPQKLGVFCRDHNLTEYILNLGDDCNAVVNGATIVEDIKLTGTQIYSNAPDQVGFRCQYGALKFSGVKYIELSAIPSYGYAIDVVCADMSKRGNNTRFVYHLLAK